MCSGKLFITINRSKPCISRRIISYWSCKLYNCMYRNELNYYHLIRSYRFSYKMAIGNFIRFFWNGNRYCKYNNNLNCNELNNDNLLQSSSNKWSMFGSELRNCNDYG